MSYRRSPTCRFCYTKGHTRRSCPSLAAKAIEATAKPVEQRDYHENRAITLQERNARNATEPRKCSYCSETGHNRNGCKSLKSDIVRLTDLNRRWKQHIASWLAADTCPLKVGALMSYKTWQGYEYTLIMTGINPAFWETNIVRIYEQNMISWFARGEVLNTTESGPYASKAGATLNFAAPAGVLLNFGENNNPNSTVISDGCMNIQPPSDWLEKIDVSANFEKGRSRRYSGRFYDNRPNFDLIEKTLKTYNIP